MIQNEVDIMSFSLSLSSIRSRRRYHHECCHEFDGSMKNNKKKTNWSITKIERKNCWFSCRHTRARAKNTVLHSCAAAAAVDDDAAVHSFKRVTQPSAQHSTQWYLSVDIVYGYRNAAKHRLLSCVALWLFLLFSFCYFFFLFAGSTQMLKAHTKSASAHSFHTGWLSTTKLFATAQSGVYMKPFSSQSACCKQQQNI